MNGFVAVLEKVFGIVREGFVEMIVVSEKGGDALEISIGDKSAYGATTD